MSNLLVSFANGKKKIYKNNITIYYIICNIFKNSIYKVSYSYINNILCDIQTRINKKCILTLGRVNSNKSQNLLQHSCEHILASACLSKYKNIQYIMGPQSHEFGFFYDFQFINNLKKKDLVLIKKSMTRIIKNSVYFKKIKISKNLISILFIKIKQHYKIKILKSINSDYILLYKSGDFFDLCRGPHLYNSKFIKSFDLIDTSGTYWKGDSSNKILQRINGVSFSSYNEINQYYYFLDESEKRDHRNLGSNLNLFMIANRYLSHNYSKYKKSELIILGHIKKTSAIKYIKFKYILFKYILKKIKNKFNIHTINFNHLKTSNFNFDKKKTWNIYLKLITSNSNKIIINEIQQAINVFNLRYPSGFIKFSIDSTYFEEIGPGLVTWLPNGGQIRIIIEQIFTSFHLDNGYQIIYSPHIAKSDLWKISGHFNFYEESMFPSFYVDGQEYLLKPMNCPFHILTYKSTIRSYKELPIRLAEFGMVYRYEMTGALHGLMRVRGFTQDDAHIFCRWDQVNYEVKNILLLMKRILNLFRLNKLSFYLSTRPNKFVGKETEWNHAEKILQSVLQTQKVKYIIDEGGGAFYGPKIDIKLNDSFNRTWQCSTIQLDFNNPKRFKLHYNNINGSEVRPVMIHRALFGSFERFFGLLIEEHAGFLPIWLAPEQICIIPIGIDHYDYSEYIKNILIKQTLRATVYKSNEKLNIKIKLAQIKKIPILCIIGNDEIAKKGVTIRFNSGQNKGFVSEEKLVNYCIDIARVPNSI